MKTETMDPDSLRQIIIDELERRRQNSESYSVIALQAGVAERTLRSLRAGKEVRYITLATIAQNLGIVVEASGAAQAQMDFGGYSRDQVAMYIGNYYLYRRSFGSEAELIRSLLSMTWSDERRCLVYKEYHEHDEHVDRDQDTSIEGVVHVPPHMGLMHFPATVNGLVRLITVKRPAIPKDGMSLCGIILTQANPDGSGFFQPAVATVVLAKLDQEDVADPVTRTLTRDARELAPILSLLGKAERAFGHIAV